MRQYGIAFSHVLGLKQTTSCTSLNSTSVTLGLNQPQEDVFNHEIMSPECESCPSDLDTRIQASAISYHSFPSQESLHDTVSTVCAKSSLVYLPAAGSQDKYNHASKSNEGAQHLNMDTQHKAAETEPPQLLFKKSPATNYQAGSHVSDARCEQGETVKPAGRDTMSNLQSKLQSLSNTTTTKHSVPQNVHGISGMSPTFNKRFKPVVRQPSQNSQGSNHTLKAGSSSASSSESNSRSSSPLSLPPDEEYADERVLRKPVVCMEGLCVSSIANDHRPMPTAEEWQDQSIASSSYSILDNSIVLSPTAKHKSIHQHLYMSTSRSSSVGKV